VVFLRAVFPIVRNTHVLVITMIVSIYLEN